jgi:beta-lactamase superfamily II metal-dependent hydrolase
MTPKVADPDFAVIPAGRLTGGDFLADIQPDDLVYFLLNVGDGDTQLVVLPEVDGKRRAVVVDVAGADKLIALLDVLTSRESELLPPVDCVFPLVVATHPHDDHIAGMGRFLDAYPLQIRELWEPGYYHPTPAYHRMMDALERHPIMLGQPTAGMVRFIDRVKITVLAPGIRLRGRFDSYGVDINNSSIALKLEFPASRVLARNEDRTYVRLPAVQSLILGADSQTLSWGVVLGDFPQLGPYKTAVTDALRKAGGVEPLRGQLFKIPHHGSKHGVSLELVEAIAPKLSLVSSVRDAGKYNFPHEVSLAQVREGMKSTTSSGTPHDPRDDHDLGIHYTGAEDSNGQALGTIAVVMSPGGRKRRVWRFDDAPGTRVDLAKARYFS